MRYVPPIRLYIFVSFLFFFLASLYQHEQQEHGGGLEVSRQKKAGFHINLNEDEDDEKPKVDTNAANKKVADALKLQSRSLGRAAARGIVLSVADASLLKAKKNREAELQLIDSLFVRAMASVPEPLTAKERLATQSWFRDDMYDQGDTVLLKPLPYGRFLAQSLDHAGTLVFDSAHVALLTHGSSDQKDSLFARHGVSGFFAKLFIARQARLIELTFGDDEDWLEKTDFTHKIMKYASVGMFIFMPLVAFCLFLLFRHQRRFYMEHLIHSVHLHAIAFLVICLFLFLPSLLLPASFHAPARGIMGLMLLVYPFLSIRVVYKQRFSRTLFKYFVLAFGYGILVALFMLGVIAYGAAVI